MHLTIGNTVEILGNPTQIKMLAIIDGFYIVNGLRNFKRIPLTEKDLNGENFELNKNRSKPGFYGIFDTGKYSVAYQGHLYKMTYIDEYEIFKKIIKK